MNFNINSGYGMQSALNSFGPGKIFYVVNAADTAVVQYLETLFPPDGDGIRRVFVATSLTADVAIQSALDACVSNRNDYVVIMPSSTNYSITVSIAVNKKGVHIVCPTGLGSTFPIGNTARLKSIVAATPVFAIAASTEAVEIAGFYIKNYTAVAAITIATGCSALNIHHNMFPMVWSGASTAASIVGAGSGGAWGSIEHNWWISESGTSITAAIACVDLQAQATGARVCHNEITIGDANIATICISNQAVKGRTDFNTFSESGGSGVTSGGTITNAISLPVNGVAIGNRGAVASGELLSGGTAATGFCDNLDGRSTAGTDIWNLEA